jgi:hypothetical protein
MNAKCSRRQFLRRTLAAAPAVAALPLFAQPAKPQAFSFLLLGDLHLDKLEHHDFAWLEKEKPGDIRQIHNYTRITAEIMPRLFATVREAIAVLNRAPATHVSFVLQVGDFVEGLCGTEALARKHNEDAISMVRNANLVVPFLFTKGNHDITGPGAPEAYRDIFHSFLNTQSTAFDGGAKLAKQSYYSIEHRDALFCFFDAYDRQSLDWLEATLARRTTRHCFVIVHPPVVPYGARSTWHIYSNPKDVMRREKLLELLGKQNAIALGGHIHKYNTLVRATPRGGRFLQFALSSIIDSTETKPKNLLSGVDEYTGDQVRVEPNYSPDSESQRRAVYASEREFVKHFEYADLPGYAVVTVDGPRVTATMHSGVTRQPWRTVDFTSLLLA